MNNPLIKALKAAYDILAKNGRIIIRDGIKTEPEDMYRIVEFKNVSIDYPLKKYTLRAVNNVSLNVKRGKITALVGESGSGKTTLSSSLIRCISEPGLIASGEVIFNGKDEQEMTQVFHFKLYSMMIFSTLLPLLPVM